ncbi:MAG: LPS-assembly protein LptD, partial [Acidobacteriota bacterium]
HYSGVDDAVLHGEARSPERAEDGPLYGRVASMNVKFIFASGLGVALLCAVPALAAQDDSSRQKPSPEGGSLVLNAEVQEQVEKGHIKARGYVDVRLGDVHLQADQVEFWSEEMLVIAEGNVVLQHGDQKIVGTRMEVNLENGTGKFYNAHGVAGQDFYFYGDVVERESEDVYVIHRGAFTSCAQPVPRWKFTAGKARIHRDHHVRLHNAFLKVKSIPVFYAPLIYYPIDEDGRSTGFLLPQIGTSTFKGVMVSESFFWAISRSMDATFTAERFSNGVGAGTEYRYVQSPKSRGQFRTYLLREKETQQTEYTLDYSMNQELPAGFRAVARANFFSSFSFQQRFHENFNAVTRRSKRASGSVSRSWSQYTFRALFDRNDTSFGRRVAVRQILPKVALSARPTKVGSTPLLFSFSSEASRLSSSQRRGRIEHQRFDILPSISYPFTKLSYLTFRTTFISRYTYYSGQLDKKGFFVDEGIDRRYYQVNLDVRGPTFSRIFNTPGNFYAERYKHVIEPQVIYSYRSQVDTFDNIIKFDSQDFVPGTNQLSFNLVNRFLAKRKTVDGKEIATSVEFLTWIVSQRYFFDVNASLYDRRSFSPFFSPNGVPSNLSPVTSKLRFRPSRSFSASWNFDYDVNFGKFSAMSVVASFSGASWGQLQGSWARRVVVNRDIVRDTFRWIGDLNLGEGLKTRVETNIDLRRNLLHFKARMTYDVQCCGFLVEFARFKFGSFRDENIIRFGVTLANVGSFGTALGGRGRIQ